MEARQLRAPEHNRKVCLKNIKDKKSYISYIFYLMMSI